MEEGIDNYDPFRNIWQPQPTEKLVDKLTWDNLEPDPETVKRIRALLEKLPCSFELKILPEECRHRDDMKTVANKEDNNGYNSL
ncbi:MAG: hypothetical protein ACYSQZ_05565 [Planctomycetota bacterium]